MIWTALFQIRVQLCSSVANSFGGKWRTRMKQRLGPGTLLALIVGSLLALHAHAGTYSHTFEFDARSLNPKPKSVGLAGSFNGWSKDATPMKNRGDGVYTVTLNDLAEGAAYYKFIVDGDKW